MLPGGRRTESGHDHNASHDGRAPHAGVVPAPNASAGSVESPSDSGRLEISTSAASSRSWVISNPVRSRSTSCVRRNTGFRHTHPHSSLMHTLYLLRHAKSSWADPALPDHERPLASRGRRDAKRIAKHLVRLGIEPELVLCSSAQRTRETLELLRPALGATHDMARGEAVCRLLRPAARAHPRASRGNRLSNADGHNPGLQQLALVLASAGAELERLEAKFPTAALATLTSEHQVEPAVAERCVLAA